MKKIWEIFTRDLINICKRPFAILILIGLMVLPSLYAWFNIAACWDPYSNTNGLSVAVVNLDKGYSLGSFTINTGEQIVANLANNDKIGWTFTDKETGMDGLNTGKYYATIIIPEDFSTKMLSVISLDIQRPEIEYYVNQKKNAIAPKITNKAIETVQTEVNATFIETVSSSLLTLLDSTFSSIQDKETSTITDVKGRLSSLELSLNLLSNSIDAIKASTDAFSKLIDTGIESLPNITSSLYDMQKNIKQLQSLIKSSITVTKQLSSSIETTIRSAQTTFSQINNSIAVALNSANSDVSDASACLSATTAYCDTVIAQTNSVISVLKNVNSSLPKPLTAVTDLIDKLSVLTNQQYQLKSQINTTVSNIKSKQKVMASDKQALENLINLTNETFNSSITNFKNNVAPKLDTLLDSTYDSLSTLYNTIGNTEKDVPTLKSALNSMKSAIKQSNTALDSVKTLVNESAKTINSFQETIDKVANDVNFKSIIEMLEKNPELISQFLSSPVNVIENDIYPVANYGSAMTPFYTILCLWVGALVLSALFKTNVKEDGLIQNVSPTTAYFGRYLLYLFVALFQALIVCIGDIWLLGIQCDNIPLFILCGVLTSLVFSNIVFTLTISFGTIGKAIAVVFLVIQVAGAGGTFPIEVLPKFFQVLNPIMPFTYGIDAMRETVAGVYHNEYWHNIFILLSYLPFSLFIGLFLRLPLLKIKNYLSKKLEETDVLL